MLTVYSAQGSPGASTTALYLAAHWASTGREVLLIEADPAGGSMSHHLGIQFTPGSASFVASGLPVLSSNLIDHSQDVLFENLHVMPSTSSPTGARGIAQWFAKRAGELRTISENEMAVIIDGGRITPDAAAADLTVNAAGVVVVARSDSSPTTFEHVGEMMTAGAAEGGPERCVVTIGDSPWSDAEWDENCGLTFCGSIKDAEEMTGDLQAFLNRTKRKSKKWRVSLEEVGERLFAYAQPPKDSPRPSAVASPEPEAAAPAEAEPPPPPAAEPPPPPEELEPPPPVEPASPAELPEPEPVYHQPVAPEPVYAQMQPIYQPPEHQQPESQPPGYQQPEYRQPPEYQDVPPPPADPVYSAHYEAPLPVYEPSQSYLPPEAPPPYYQPVPQHPLPPPPPLQQQPVYRQQPAPEPPQPPAYHQQPALEPPQPPAYYQPRPPPQQPVYQQPPAYQQPTPSPASHPASPAAPGLQHPAPQQPAPSPASHPASPAAPGLQYPAPQHPAQQQPPQIELAPSGSFRDWAARLHGQAPHSTTTGHGGVS